VIARLGAALAAALLLAAPLGAEEFPTRPVTMIVVFAPGGATDAMARVAAAAMAKSLGQPVVVENVTGAGGTIGGARGAAAAPDGYTLTVGSLGSHAASGAIYRNVAYDARQLTPIGLIAGTPLFLAVRRDFPARDYAGLAALVRASPGAFSNANAGIGSTNHLACALFTTLAGLSFNEIPYRGEGPAMQDLIAGTVDTACLLAPAAVPQLQAGTIRALMVAGPGAQGVPGSAEAGLPGFVFQGWNAIWAPRGTPAAVQARLAGALAEALADPALRKRIEDLGAIPALPEAQGPAALQALVEREVARWAEVVKAAGITPP